MQAKTLKNWIFSLFLILPFLVNGQQDELGNWVMYFGTNKLSDKYSLHTEFQYRNHKVGPSVEQLLPRIGLNYHFQSNGILTGGYAYIPSYKFESEQSAPEVTEHRIFEQLILKNSIGKMNLEHRYRIEQRWVSGDYRNRFRYRLMATYPLNKPKIQEGAFFLALYDEVFINAEFSFFDRNRLYGAMGYQFMDNAGVQVGLLRQTVNSFSKLYLQFALVYNLDFTGGEN